MEGISSLIFHCVFNGDSSVTHFMHEGLNKIAEPLPNMYAVCVAENHKGKKIVRAGFVIKTTFHHESSDFPSALRSVCMSVKELMPFVDSNKTSFLPAKMGVRGIQLPTEDECLYILFNQYIKHSRTSLPN
ncbi:hypothetical protein [Citrobacter koseri]|uniref:hypothetical protein n=1 Tax=Citrobacter koseri TaxID=545 RepID=UPI001F328460|nr:hypothetical protein [Citrobacter koseri]